MLNTERKHWATLNRIITTRLNKDVYQIVASFFPDDEVEFEALDPKELLKWIEERLVTTDQIEYKRLRFELAKQTPEENPWKGYVRRPKVQRALSLRITRRELAPKKYWFDY